MELTPAEGRVLGCLIEKQVDGPVAYSLTLNELRYACNQTIGRDPVVTYDDRMVEETLMSLKSKGLARFVSATPRDQKPGPSRCRHRADERWRLSAPQLMVLSVLLLRGPQSVEQVRALVSGHPLLETAPEVEAVLDSLAGRTPTPFAIRLVPAPDQADTRWSEVLTRQPEPDEILSPEAIVPEEAQKEVPVPVPGPSPVSPRSAAVPAPSPLTMVELADRLSGIERRLAGIEAVLGSLRQALEDDGQTGSDTSAGVQPTSRVRT